MPGGIKAYDDTRARSSLDYRWRRFSIYDLIVINALPVTLLTRRILEQMAQRDRGIIINIASSAALFELSEWALYSAIKVGVIAACRRLNIAAARCRNIRAR